MAGWLLACGQVHTPLLSSARGDALVQVCTVCFCASELRELASSLPEGSKAYLAIANGLQVLYPERGPSA